VDNLLAEDLSRAVATAEEESGGTVDVGELAPFAWDRLLLVARGTPDAAIDERLGGQWSADPGVAFGELLVLLDEAGSVVRFFDYRGEGALRGLRGAVRRAPARARGARGARPDDHAEGVRMGRLDELDLSLRLSKEEEAERLEKAQDELLALRLRLGGLMGDPHAASPAAAGGELGPPLCVVLEGWDASGKGGAIKRLVHNLDPRHVRVKSYAAPTPDEKRHHWLWRFWPALPGWGGMAVLDRSWYGRVLVERVEGYATEEEWRRAYGEIDDYERMLAADGMVLVKLWLHVSAEEQLARFEARAKNPLKAWKLTPDDWRNREKRPQYCEALEDMFEHTDTEAAPWHLVEADSKRWARVKVIETVIAAAREGLERHGTRPPP
jgi:polyphosphate kinase 2 (PPK2 family)